MLHDPSGLLQLELVVNRSGEAIRSLRKKTASGLAPANTFGKPRIAEQVVEFGTEVVDLLVNALLELSRDGQDHAPDGLLHEGARIAFNMLLQKLDIIAQQAASRGSLFLWPNHQVLEPSLERVGMPSPSLCPKDARSSALRGHKIKAK